MVLEFAAQPGNSLPRFIASFAHPVHIDSEIDLDAIPEESNRFEQRTMDVTALIIESPHCQSPRPLPSQPSILDDSAWLVGRDSYGLASPRIAHAY